jgi:hypothetical protein
MALDYGRMAEANAAIRRIGPNGKGHVWRTWLFVSTPLIMITALAIALPFLRPIILAEIGECAGRFVFGLLHLFDSP